MFRLNLDIFIWTFNITQSDSSSFVHHLYTLNSLYGLQFHERTSKMYGFRWAVQVWICGNNRFKPWTNNGYTVRPTCVL